MAEFTGFPGDFFKFFEDLEQNNNRPWFNENKSRYYESVVNPISEFIVCMAPQLKKISPHYIADPKPHGGSMFRIYRDTRFSNDKTPHKVHMGAVIAEGGRKEKSLPGFYFQFNDQDIQIHGGGYMIEPKALNNLRDYIASDIKSFREVIDNPQFKETFGEINGEKNKRLPKELMPAAEIEPLILNKQLYFSAYLKPELILNNDISDLIFAHYLAGKECIEYLKEGIKDR